ncbi:unnamed protein product, partial [Cyprideis torosa]
MSDRGSQEETPGVDEESPHLKRMRIEETATQTTTIATVEDNVTDIPRSATSSPTFPPTQQ